MIVCFSGHRPQNLPQDRIALNQLKSMLYLEISDCIDRGCRRFISGLAAGIDLWASEMVISFMEKYPDIELVGVLPYRTHENSVKGEWKFIHYNVLGKCTEIVCISEYYQQDVFKRRNYYMVDNSTHLIAVVKNYKSGTGQTIAYANKLGKAIKLIKID